MGLNGNVQKNDAGIAPPQGCEAREEVWQFAEILRRAYPDRAKERLGLEEELKTREAFKAWYDGMMDAAWAKFIAAKNKAKPRRRPYCCGSRSARVVSDRGEEVGCLSLREALWHAYRQGRTHFLLFHAEVRRQRCFRAAPLGGIAGIYAA